MPLWAILLAWFGLNAAYVGWRLYLTRDRKPEYLAFIGEHPWPEDR